MSDEELYENQIADGHRDVIQTIEMLEEALPHIEQPIGIYIALYDMYTDLEDMSQAGACLMEAARRVSLGQQPELTYFLYTHLELFAQVNPEAQDVYERLAHTIARDEGELGKNTLHLEQRKIYKYDLIPELLLAQHLKRAREISDAEYNIILHDLCYYSTAPVEAPNTVLFVLQQRELPHESQVIEFLSHDSGVPFIDLTMMTPPASILQNLPLEFVKVRGACGFGAVGNETMVAVHNPYNLQLRDDVSLLVKNSCHYYICDARGYENMLHAVRLHNSGE